MSAFRRSCLHNLLIVAAVAAAGAQQQPAVLDSHLSRDSRPDDSKVELRSQDAVGTCHVKQTQSDRDEMLWQALSGAAVQLRAAVPPAFANGPLVLPPASANGKNQVLGTFEPLGAFEPSPEIRIANSSNSSLITLVHPDDRKIMNFGTHRQKEFKDVFKNSPDYCAWVRKVPKASGPLKDFQDYVNQRSKGVPPKRRLDKNRGGPQARHVPLAFASERHLKNLTVFVVYMTWLDLPEDLPENPNLLHRFVKRMVWMSANLVFDHVCI